MTDSFMDTALNYQPGIRIAPDGRGRQWWATNGIGKIPLCRVCRQPVYEGHVDCTCDKSHAERCTRPTYAELKDQHDALVAALTLVAYRYESGDIGDLINDVPEIEAALEATK